jgi:hypothetical protein
VRGSSAAAICRVNSLYKIQQKLTLNILETARKYCMKRMEAAEEKRASRARAAREKTAMMVEAVEEQSRTPAAFVVSRRPSKDGSVLDGSEDFGDLNAGERLLEVGPFFSLHMFLVTFAQPFSLQPAIEICSVVPDNYRESWIARLLQGESGQGFDR